MAYGKIIKALSGFYYVEDGERLIQCRARGKFRLDGTSPLVGDRVEYSDTENGNGYIQSVLPRRNWFVRPTVANIDLLIIVAAAVNPITDPFLIDRQITVCEHAGCDVIICINKSDLDPGDRLFDIYNDSGFNVIRTSAVTEKGIDELREAISGKTCAFAGNSGVGKSSILNAIDPSLSLQVGEVSEKLGRGRHTTRHVQLYSLGDETYIADTPGFASFDMELMEPIRKEELQHTFREFEPYIGKCRFSDCAHLAEPGCAVLEALESGKIKASRHNSYAKLYEISSQIKEWELDQ